MSREIQHVRHTFHLSVSGRLREGGGGVAYQWQSSASEVWDELLNSFFTLSISAHWTSVFRSRVPPGVLCRLWVFTRRALKIYVLYLHTSTQLYHSVLKQTHQNRKYGAYLHISALPRFKGKINTWSTIINLHLVILIIKLVEFFFITLCSILCMKIYIYIFEEDV